MSTKVFSGTDAAVLLGIPGLTAISWGIPEHFWPKICRQLGPIAIPTITDNPRSVLQLIHQILGNHQITQSPEAILTQVAGEQIQSRLQLLKDYFPGGWQPQLQLIGREHIDTALENDHGVILWLGYFVFCELVPKIAFHRAGLAVHHLSSAYHGFSSTRFGTRYLNRIQTRIEDRYLAERVVLSPENPTKAMLTLAYRLRNNQVISITAHKNAKKPLKVKFLDGYLYLAPGAPLLAQKTKAALLPVLPLRNQAGELTVRVESPLQISADIPEREVTENLTQQYARLLEPYVLQFPGQWLGWNHCSLK